jgi:hypothetical protein
LVWLLVLALFLFRQAKPYYLSPAFPMLLAAGGVALESLLARWRHPWPGVALTAVLAASGCVTASIVVPLLEPSALVAYQERLGLIPKAEERGPQAALPQHFADRFGWPELAAHTDAPWAMPYEHQRSIWICRQPKQSLNRIWPQVKHFI